MLNGLKNERVIEKEEKQLFLNKLRREGTTIGTMNPVSRKLVSHVASLVPQISSSRIVEIGAATGRVTRGLLRAGAKGDHFCAIESDESCYQFLEKSVSELDLDHNHPIIKHGDAYDLEELIPQSWHKKVDCIISTVPLFAMEEGMRREIITKCLAMLSPTGIILHVTYGHMSPIHFMTDVDQKKVKSLWWNVPPAFIWSFKKTRRKMHEAA